MHLHNQNSGKIEVEAMLLHSLADRVTILCKGELPDNFLTDEVKAIFDDATTYIGYPFLGRNFHALHSDQFILMLLREED